MPRLPQILGLAVLALAAALSGCRSTPGASREFSISNAIKTASVTARPVTPDFQAFGFTPDWEMDIRATELSLRTDGREYRFLTSPVKSLMAGPYYITTAGEHTLTMQLANRLCTTERIPYPTSISLKLDQQLFNGCGGNPASFLTAAEWVVTGILDQPVQPTGKPGLVFGKDGRFSGQAFCNSIIGSYILSRKGLFIQRNIGIMKTCTALLMAQEAEFLKALDAVNGFSIDSDGHICLLEGKRRLLTIRQGATAHANDIGSQRADRP